MTTAFPESTQNLAALVRDVILDIPALTAPLLPCDLATCRGTCCHDGVYLSSEEAAVIRDIAETDKEPLAKLGADLPERVVVFGKFRDITSGPKTATRHAPMKQWVEDYPEHFAETNCVFLLPDARCALQAHAMDQNLDPWYYKPLTCWIHPLSFTTDSEGRDTLTLYSKENDPHNFEDYPGFVSKTHCGRRFDSPLAKPAYEVLKTELQRLSDISNRDLLQEIREQV